MTPFPHRSLAFLVASVALASPARAQHTFKIPPRYEVREFAREPMIMNPVGISAAEDGSVYVTETRRRKTSNLDIRANTDWLNDELSFKSVADKEAFYLRTLSPANSDANARRVPDHNGDGSHDYLDLTVHSELIHRLVDTDGDGVADKSTLFADDFRTMLTGVAAGVHAEGGRVFATIAPDVWMLRDTDGDGISDERKAIATGFGVHVAYAGHNLHGPIIGPDGRLYWTVGDTGSDLAPNEGALYRCDPDGGTVELFARGLRNAQEVVFDKYGNIFTGDNDGDFGDRERWYHIVEGGDYGWRNSWQYQVGEKYGSGPDTYSVWNEEKLWHLPFPGQAAYIIPATAHIAAGPCGMTYYPGTGFGPEMNDRFFLAHFTGSAGSSKIHAYKVEPDGASYRLSGDEPFITNITATGVDFSPDGSRLYFSEWTGGWSLGTEGRVHYLLDPKMTESEEITRTHDLLANGVADRTPVQLADLLPHPNMNVRRMAQFELARRGGPSIPTFEHIAKSSENQLARIHALWGLEQIHRRTGDALFGVVDLLRDPDAEIRAQTARMMGEGRVEAAIDGLISRLGEPNARVRFEAAMALGKLHAVTAFDPVLQMLALNGTADRFLRHAGIMYLTWLNEPSRLAALATHPSADVRMAASVALRKLGRPEVEAFLHDPDELVVIEAARAINDVPIPGSTAKLSGLIEDTDSTNEWLLRRVLNATFRIGGQANARRLVAFASNAAMPEEMRLEALRMLADWESPNSRDRVTGAWLPIDRQGRSLDGMENLLRESFPALIRGSAAVQAKSSRLLAERNIKASNASLLATATDREKDTSVRVVALDLIADDPSAIPDEQLAKLLADPDPSVYAAALELGKATNGKDTLESIRAVITGNDVLRAQAAARGLAGFQSPQAKRIVREAFSLFRDGDLPEEIGLDVLNAAENSDDPQTRAALKAWRSAQQDEDPLAAFRVALHGGNAERGSTIFRQKTELQCIRCHKVDPTAESSLMDAAPNLSDVGSRTPREYLLESIVRPNAAFAEGYEQVSVQLKDGGERFGRVLRRTDDRLELQVAGESEDEFSDEPPPPTEEVIPMSEVASITKGLSGMPEGLANLMTLHELRDLIEFLATRRESKGR